MFPLSHASSVRISLFAIRSYSTAPLSTRSLTMELLKVKMAPSKGEKAKDSVGKAGQQPLTANVLRMPELEGKNRSPIRTGVQDTIFELSLFREIAKPHPMPLDQSEMRLAVSAGLSTTRSCRISVARSAFFLNASPGISVGDAFRFLVGPIC